MPCCHPVSGRGLKHSYHQCVPSISFGTFCNHTQGATMTDFDTLFDATNNESGIIIFPNNDVIIGNWTYSGHGVPRLSPFGDTLVSTAPSIRLRIKAWSISRIISPDWTVSTSFMTGMMITRRSRPMTWRDCGRSSTMTKPYGCLPQSIGTSACPVLIDGRLPRVKNKCGPDYTRKPVEHSE